MLTKVTVRQQQRMVQVGALVVHLLERGQLLDVHHLRVTAEGDQLKVVAEGKRLLMSVCSASAVRFIGTQRPSMTIENDVSTSNATQACVRASVSCTSTSSIVIVTPGLGRPRPARRGCVARDPRDRVRDGARHIPGSVSPNAHSRVAPDRSPAAPACRTSLLP